MAVSVSSLKEEGTAVKKTFKKIDADIMTLRNIFGELRQAMTPNSRITRGAVLGLLKAGIRTVAKDRTLEDFEKRKIKSLAGNFHQLHQAARRGAARIAGYDEEDTVKVLEHTLSALTYDDIILMRIFYELETELRTKNFWQAERLINVGLAIVNRDVLAIREELKLVNRLLEEGLIILYGGD
jgi:hypothetical protein